MRALIDELAKMSSQRSIPSGRDTGLNGVPEAGDEFVVVPDEKVQER